MKAREKTRVMQVQSVITSHKQNDVQPVSGQQQGRKRRPGEQRWGLNSLSFTCLREVAVVLKYLREQCGAKEIGVIGFCWGGAAVQHLMLKNPHMKTGVSLYGESQTPIMM